MDFFWKELSKLTGLIPVNIRVILEELRFIHGGLAQVNHASIKEMEKEFQDEKQKIVHALHIIDAILLGGQEIRGLPLDKRTILCSKFARAMNRPLAHQNASTVRPIPVRCKTMLPMMELDSFFSNVSVHELINGAKVLGSDLDSFDALESKRFYIPRGLLFVRSVQTASKGAEKQLDFGKAFASRILWAWSKTSQIYSSAQRFEVTKEPDLIYRQDFDEFIEKSGDKK